MNKYPDSDPAEIVYEDEPERVQRRVQRLLDWEYGNPPSSVDVATDRWFVAGARPGSNKDRRAAMDKEEDDDEPELRKVKAIPPEELKARLLRSRQKVRRGCVLIRRSKPEDLKPYDDPPVLGQGQFFSQAKPKDDK